MSKRNKGGNANVQTAATEQTSDMAVLNDLLAGLPTEVEPPVESSEPASFADAVGASDEIIEPAADQAASGIDDILDAAAAELENQEHYQQQEAGDNADAPAADVPTVEAAAKPKRKAKSEKTAKPPKAPKEPKPEAEPKAPRVTYHGNRKSAVLNNRVGGKIDDMLVLEVADLALEPAALQAKQAAIKEDLDTKVAKKVAEKAVMLFKDLSAGKVVSNEVMNRAFKVLARDGYLTSGDKGNLQVDLREKYSLGTARSQANQMFALFPFLKIANKSSKGRLEPNAGSTILTTVCATHGLTIKQAE